jgi:peptidyl-prolyl cis-trans isomerase B (cyclophilin B)
VAQNKNQERDAREARERLKRYNARQEVHAHQLSRRKRDNIYAVAGVIVIAAIAAVTQIFYFTSGPGAPTPEPTSSATATPTPTATPEANVGNVPSPDAAEARIWTGELTLNDTKLSIELDGAAAPQAVASVIQDITDGYYVDKTCHRLVDSDTAGLIQCGSIDGLGGGDTDYSFGPVENAPADSVYPVGSIAMARADSEYSNGHQFFIVYKEAQLSSADGLGYTIVGQVTSGLDDLQANITDAGLTPASEDSPNDGAPVTPTTITSVTIK